MSRFAERAAAAALVAGLLSATPPAVATPTPSPQGPTVIRPDPIPQPHTFPVLDLVPQVFELRVVTGAADGSSLTERSENEVDITLSADVLFDKDRAEIRPEAGASLDDLAAELDRRPVGRVTVTGYTDDLGPEEHGYRLSEQRAEAVRQHISASLDRHQVEVIGKGEEDPASPNDSEANRAQNRRVVIHWEPV
ncbi:MAG: OmpA family protein [Propionibacteriaceae bacterium]|nr:OmpA family protein [Propionibacteriaceae bacterium]